MRVRGGDEALEQRVRLVRLAAELGMKLARDEERMLRQLDDLHQPPVGRLAAEAKIRLLETLAVGIVEFVAMPVALIDHERPIELRRLGPHGQLARLRPEPHRAAFLRHLRLSCPAWR